MARGREALNQAISNTHHASKEWKGDSDWEYHVSQLEKENREEEEVIKVVDGPSAERAMEILNRGIVIQDGSINGILDRFDYEHSRTETESGVEDTIVVRAIRPDGEKSDEYWGTRWTLTTPKSRRKMSLTGSRGGTAAERLERLEWSSMEGIEEEEGGGLENEAINRKSTKKGRGTIQGDGLTLKDLEEKAGLGFVEPAVPRPFKEVASNLFGQAPPAWKLEDSQEGWRQEGTQATMAWADDVEVPELMETGGLSTGESVEEKEARDLELKRWVEANPLTITFEPAGRKGERAEGRREMNKSKHAIPELSAEQVEEMAKEKVEGVKEAAAAEEEGAEGEDERMGEEDEGEEDEGEEEEEDRGRWNGIWDNRDLKSILYCIVNNGKIVEQIAGLKPKDRSYRLARDADTARDMIRASGGVIEGNW
ncbi:hypothetical protein L211DRAFT_854558 [Terfezia boudieri ATCC MYA-4762]|uniref:Uncharacterized protein n=1 Tax=Terfezia boudieri ATCC MYA-4762 TaxID=1051890 RepID=A0A3N4L636_9PEZI|nr:hypothetical protein L211DRAFT_854558 [Terfezia boudieri ATCC MYA-4762]